MDTCGSSGDDIQKLAVCDDNEKVVGRMGKSLSSDQRERLLKEMAQQTFDVLVIGGGITGAGIALDAA
ncbi:hypothetical protein JDS79_41755, partial [Bacillus cereus]|nr:hypothetical protein [Bacillus cereus]